MMNDFDPEALRADMRRTQERVNEVAERARSKLGVGTPRSELTDGLTAQEIERDTASIRKIMAVWRAIDRWQVEAQIAALEHERKGAQNQRHLDAIAGQEAVFRAELERMDREGDYVEPEGPETLGLAYVGRAGRGLIIA